MPWSRELFSAGADIRPSKRSPLQRSAVGARDDVPQPANGGGGDPPSDGNLHLDWEADPKAHEPLEGPSATRGPQPRACGWTAPGQGVGGLLCIGTTGPDPHLRLPPPPPPPRRHRWGLQKGVAGETAATGPVHRHRPPWPALAPDLPHPPPQPLPDAGLRPSPAPGPFLPLALASTPRLSATRGAGGGAAAGAPPPDSPPPPHRTSENCPQLRLLRCKKEL